MLPKRLLLVEDDRALAELVKPISTRRLCGDPDR